MHLQGEFAKPICEVRLQIKIAGIGPMRLSAVVAVSALTMTSPFLASRGDVLSQPTETLAPQQISLVHATCRQATGLEEGQAEFDGCVDSLSQTLSSKVRDELVLKRYGDCEHAGLLRDTPEFSDCVLNRQTANADQLKQEIQAQGTSLPPVRLAYDSDAQRMPARAFSKAVLRNVIARRSIPAPS
jgi:hypothetical protein